LVTSDHFLNYNAEYTQTQTEPTVGVDKHAVNGSGVKVIRFCNIKGNYCSAD